MDWHQPNGQQAGSCHHASPDLHGRAEAEVLKHGSHEEGTG